MPHIIEIYEKSGVRNYLEKSVDSFDLVAFIKQNILSEENIAKKIVKNDTIEEELSKK